MEQFFIRVNIPISHHYYVNESYQKSEQYLKHVYQKSLLYYHLRLTQVGFHHFGKHQYSKSSLYKKCLV